MNKTKGIIYKHITVRPETRTRFERLLSNFAASKGNRQYSNDFLSFLLDFYEGKINKKKKVIK